MARRAPPPPRGLQRLRLEAAQCAAAAALAGIPGLRVGPAGGGPAGLGIEVDVRAWGLPARAVAQVLPRAAAPGAGGVRGGVP